MNRNQEAEVGDVGAEGDKRGASSLNDSILYDFELDAKANADNPKGGRKKKPPGFPIRPRSAYNFFFAEQKDLVNAERQHRKETGTLDPREDAFFTMGKTIGRRWRALASEGRKPYEKLAKEDQLRYKKAVDDFNLAERRKKLEDEDETTSHAGELAPSADNKGLEGGPQSRKKQRIDPGGAWGSGTSYNKERPVQSRSSILHSGARGRVSRHAVPGGLPTSPPPPPPPEDTLTKGTSTASRGDGLNDFLRGSNQLFSRLPPPHMLGVPTVLSSAGAYPHDMATATNPLAAPFLPTALLPASLFSEGTQAIPLQQGSLANSLHAAGLQNSVDRLLLAQAAAAPAVTTSFPYAASLGTSLPHHHHLSSLSAAPPGALHRAAFASGGAGVGSVIRALRQQEADKRAYLEALVQQRVVNQLSDRAWEELLQQQRESERKKKSD